MVGKEALSPFRTGLDADRARQNPKVDDARFWPPPGLQMPTNRVSGACCMYSAVHWTGLAYSSFLNNASDPGTGFPGPVLGQTSYVNACGPESRAVEDWLWTIRTCFPAKTHPGSPAQGPEALLGHRK